MTLKCHHYLIQQLDLGFPLVQDGVKRKELDDAFKKVTASACVTVILNCAGFLPALTSTPLSTGTGRTRAIISKGRHRKEMSAKW
jgi:hypothetical protein